MGLGEKTASRLLTWKLFIISAVSQARKSLWLCKIGLECKQAGPKWLISSTDSITVSEPHTCNV